jgi:hypothetical protein
LRLENFIFKSDEDKKGKWELECKCPKFSPVFNFIFGYDTKKEDNYYIFDKFKNFFKTELDEVMKVLNSKAPENEKK